MNINGYDLEQLLEALPDSSKEEEHLLFRWDSLEKVEELGAESPTETGVSEESMGKIEDAYLNKQRNHIRHSLTPMATANNRNAGRIFVLVDVYGHYSFHFCSIYSQVFKSKCLLSPMFRKSCYCKAFFSLFAI